MKCTPVWVPETSQSSDKQKSYRILQVARWSIINVDLSPKMYFLSHISIHASFLLFHLNFIYITNLSCPSRIIWSFPLYKFWTRCCIKRVKLNLKTSPRDFWRNSLTFRHQKWVNSLKNTGGTYDSCRG